MKILIKATVKELQRMGIWEQVEKIKGYQYYAIAEGLLNSDSVVEVTDEDLERVTLVNQMA